MTNDPTKLYHEDPEYYPGNHPYCLYKYDAGGGIRGEFVAKSAMRLSVKLNLPINTKVVPVYIPDLIKTLGHQKTSNYLKKFGKKWMTRSGNAFFENESV